ncbi:hypothetical protein B5C26_00810 [Photorhabdus luminescens]|uniref:hypothetical protein n=1 Tax=Photorhabdus luminescens TaxID=29488 RepID=UPI000B4D7CAC|nr:hypothetical protein [Photorhabdus luminescens]OWO86991.1 hypothetical protein B5C26_00810 [Photorhabdus luminescens]
MSLNYISIKRRYPMERIIEIAHEYELSKFDMESIILEMELRKEMVKYRKELKNKEIQTFGT